MQSTATDPAGAGYGSVSTYVTGLVIALLLTGGAFALVIYGGGWPRGWLVAGICCAAVAQIVVQLHYFLHLSSDSQARWNVMALILTLMILVLFVGGTLWIMSDLNQRMMG